MTNRKLKLQDLKIGMHVKTEQLSELFGVWIYINPLTDKSDEVDILYFCTSETKDDTKIKEIVDKYGKATIIFQPAFYEDDDNVVYVG